MKKTKCRDEGEEVKSEASIIEREAWASSSSSEPASPPAASLIIPAKGSNSNSLSWLTREETKESLDSSLVYTVNLLPSAVLDGKVLPQVQQGESAIRHRGLGNLNNLAGLVLGVAVLGL